MTNNEYELGDEVRVRIIGVFLRNDGDHKMVAVTTDRPADDLANLTAAEMEDLHRMYPREDIGEGWFGKEAAAGIIRTFLNPIHNRAGAPLR